MARSTDPDRQSTADRLAIGVVALAGIILVALVVCTMILSSDPAATPRTCSTPCSR